MTNPKELILNSVDARCLKYSVKLKLAVYLVLSISISLLIVAAFWRFPKEMMKALSFYNVFFILGYVPIILISLIKLKRMIAKSNLYVYVETVLSDYDTYMGQFYFRISAETPQGNKLVGNTEAIYSTKSINANFEQWHNKRVLVAYDTDNARIIVLKKL